MADKPKIFFIGEKLEENEHRLNQAAKKALIAMNSDVHLNFPYWIQILQEWMEKRDPREEVDPRLETNIEAARARFWQRPRWSVIS